MSKNLLVSSATRTKTGATRSVTLEPPKRGGLAGNGIALYLLVAALGVSAADGAPQPAAGPSVDSAIAAEQEYARALRDNDADAVGRMLADDWQVVSTDGGWGQSVRAGFIEAIKSGQFIRRTMEISDIKVRLYGNVAIVTERVSTSGTFGAKAQSFDVKEVQTDVLVWGDGRWKSALTHETKVKV